jgi:hypothetical protein
MTIRRAPDAERLSYTVIENRTLQDAGLSWEARGMLAFLLSKPLSWHVQPPSLVKESPNAKRDKVYQILAELEEHGHLVTKRIHDDLGHFLRVERWVYEVAQPIYGKSVSGVDEPEPTPTTPEREAAIRLCEALNGHITANGFKPFAVNATAIASMERLIRLDKRTEAEIRVVIEWCQRDSFWFSNIRSAEKLRKHYETLLAQMARGKTSPVDELEYRRRKADEDARREAERQRELAEKAPMPPELKKLVRSKP